MNTQEKSLKLADLMGYKYKIIMTMYGEIIDIGDYIFDPYDDDDNGLAQFASILLKFPEVMMEGGEGFYHNPTQADILDEILRANGIEL